MSTIVEKPKHMAVAAVCKILICAFASRPKQSMNALHVSSAKVQLYVHAKGKNTTVCSHCRTCRRLAYALCLLSS